MVLPKIKMINLFAGPGVGKSIIAAEIFVKLKRQFVSAEQVREYAKDYLYKYGNPSKADPTHLLEKQSGRQKVLRGHVDVAVTDSPILLVDIYRRLGNNLPPDLFTQEVFHHFNHPAFENFNFFIERDVSHPYESAGREQSLSEALLVDGAVKKFLIENGVKFESVGYGTDCPVHSAIADFIIGRVMGVTNAES